MSANNYFGYNIKKYREFYGISQAEMAQSLGFTQSDISRYELELFIPDGKRLFSMSNAMGVSANDLIAKPIDWEARAAIINNSEAHNRSELDIKTSGAT